MPQMGWGGVKDGELLRLAEGEFDVLITVDRNLPFQQNLTVLDLAVLVLQGRSNRLADLQVLFLKFWQLLTQHPRQQPRWSVNKTITLPTIAPPSQKQRSLPLDTADLPPCPKTAIALQERRSHLRNAPYKSDRTLVTIAFARFCVCRYSYA